MTNPARLSLSLLAAVGMLLASVSCVDEEGGGGQGVDLGHGTSSGGGGPSAKLCDDGMPHPSCPCDEADEGTRAGCGEVQSHVGTQLVCGYGETVCSGGKWQRCIINNSVSMQPGSDTQSLGPPGGCATNPCDPYCGTFPTDDPSGEGSGGGIVEGDGGITLTPPDGSGGAAPGCSGGPDTGSCTHHVCEVGGPLTAGCDPQAVQPPPPPSSVTAFEEHFSDNSQGWTLGSEWEISAAQSSSGHQYGYADPSSDTTPGSDNGVAGVDIGGNAATSVHGYRYLTSPVVNLSGLTAPITLTFQRWLNSDYPPYMRNRIQVYDGSSWVTIWSGEPTQSSWSQETFDITPYVGTGFRVRFGFRVGNSGVYRVSSWNIDDVTITSAGSSGPPPPPPPSCVDLICQQDPSCCSAQWDAGCVAKVSTVCAAQCLTNGKGECFACYEDGADHDGDGFSFDDGDCLDCDAGVNPGAFDFPGNGEDEDCNNVIDDEPQGCDGGLALASNNPYDYAKAIDLCRTANANEPVGPNRTWGVTDAQLVGADGVSAIDSRSKGILSQFGNVNNKPRQGSTMAVFSSGTARSPGDPGYVNPNGQSGSYNHGNSCAFPSGFPQNASGCPVTVGNANDSAGLKLDIRAPTNANSFAYDFHYFTSEYPEWVCTEYNDHFVALLTSNQTNGNISFDMNNDPVSVNIAFFNVPGCDTCTDPILANTGFDGTCWGKSCGGSTEWLTTTAPVDPGENITIHFSTWDQGDHVWDSTVLVDNFVWSVDPATVETNKSPPAPPPPTYTDAWFERVYDLTGYCPPKTAIVWGLWSWSVDAQSDSSIAFSVATADTVSGLGTAAEVPLAFSNPPGPVGLAGQPVVAQSATVPDTQGGSAVVDATLLNQGLPRNENVLRVRSHLIPSTDGYTAPTLLSWNMQFQCLPSE